jgi:hypothetical protein
MLTLHHTFFAMGSDCSIHLCADSRAACDKFAEAAEAEVVRIESRYSRYRADSELSRIDARVRDLKPELEQFSMDPRRAPKRIFDAHPPDQRAQVRLDLRPPSQ